MIVDNAPFQYPFTLEEVLGVEKNWPLLDTLIKLVESTEILLKREDYDRHAWEQLSATVQSGREFTSLLDSLEIGISNKNGN